ncbi:hypothetical protein D3C85_1680710 [compost metagenome]
MTRTAEANAAIGQLPALLQASLLQQVDRQLEDELLAVGRIRQVYRIVRVDQQ